MQQVKKYRVRRGNNARAVPAQAQTPVPIPMELEIAALDDCGPLTRRAICESPLPTLACSIISQIIELNDKIEEENKKRAALGHPLRPYVDPKHPDLDRRLALGVIENNARMIAGDVELGDRALEWAKMGIKPLIARPSAKTARERRKTEGRRFRGW